MRYLALSLLLAFALPAFAAPQLYVAQLDRSTWLLAEQRDSCALSHDIPLFGTAVLAQHAQGAPELTLETLSPPLHGGSAELLSRTPPHWQDAHERFLEMARIHPHKRTFHLSRQTAQQVIAELLAGRMMVLRFQSWWNASTAEVALSNVGFRAGYGEYVRCVDKLQIKSAPIAPQALAAMGYPPAAVAPQVGVESQQHVLLFESGAAYLTASARAHLRALSRELRSHPSARVTATGFGDSRGASAYDRQLAARRAEAVRSYLVDLGLMPERTLLHSASGAAPGIGPGQGVALLIVEF
jgi:sodium-type flagellar protein MotY